MFAKYLHVCQAFWVILMLLPHCGKRRLLNPRILVLDTSRNQFEGLKVTWLRNFLIYVDFSLCFLLFILFLPS